MREILAVLMVALLCGCATNGVFVSEVSPDGTQLNVQQFTISTWGAKTEEGAGDFGYTATSADGDSFEMTAGAAVKGQSAQDPMVGLAQLVATVAPIVSPLVEAQAEVAKANAAKPAQVITLPDGTQIPLP